MDAPAEFSVHALRDYALIADGERGAVIGPRGDIAWLCAPVWNSDAVFSNLIGGPGCYAVTPMDTYTWGGYYERRSLMWNSRWVTTSAIVECREALAMPADPDRIVLLRRLRGVSGGARMRVSLDLRAGFGTDSMVQVRRDEEGTWTGRSGPIRFRWSGAEGAQRRRGAPLVCELELVAGDVHDLVLEISTKAMPEDPVDADVYWSATAEAWRAVVPSLAPDVLGRRDAELSLAVLAGLTSRDGGMAAAATMSLPERAREGRNYDYRYAWIRDQCYVGHAAAAHGVHSLVDGAVRFVSDRILADGPQLKPAYTVSGGSVPPERTLSHLAGYPGGADKTGNWVTQQFQLDALGEILELLATAAGHDRLDIGQWDAAEAAVSAIEQRWLDPDAGIWELDDQHWAHSRLTCVSGLRAVARQAPHQQSGRWSALADAILADVSADCLHPDGRWQRSPDDDRVDAALLLPIIRGALPGSDPRTVATVDAIEKELRREDYVYRFRPDDRPLGEAEGAFLLCGFLLAQAQHQQGNVIGGRVLFERNRSASGTPGLLSEEFDIQQRQLRGNLPQAFVHALLLECSAVLRSDDGG